MQHKNEETRREQEFEARLRKLLGHMTYNEKLMLLSLLEGAQPGQSPSPCPPRSDGKTSQ